MKFDIVDIVLGIVSTIINIVSYFIVKKLTNEIKFNFKWLRNKYKLLRIGMFSMSYKYNVNHGPEDRAIQLKKMYG